MEQLERFFDELRLRLLLSGSLCRERQEKTGKAQRQRNRQEIGRIRLPLLWRLLLTSG
jgi:hypothetical protein